MPIVVIQPEPPGTCPPPEALEGMRQALEILAKNPDPASIQALYLGSCFTFAVVDSDTPIVVEMGGEMAGEGSE